MNVFRIAVGLAIAIFGFWLGRWGAKAQSDAESELIRNSPGFSRFRFRSHVISGYVLFGLGIVTILFGIAGS